MNGCSPGLWVGGPRLETVTQFVSGEKEVLSSLHQDPVTMPSQIICFLRKEVSLIKIDPARHAILYNWTEDHKEHSLTR